MYKVVLAADSKFTGRLYTRESYPQTKAEAFDRAKKMAGEGAAFFSRGPASNKEIGYRGEHGSAYIYELPAEQNDD